MPVMQFRSSDPAIRFCGRSETKGPESRMVAAFMREYEMRLEKEEGCYAIFYEPQMPTGYPDCVIVKYNARIYAGWRADVEALSECDVKVLSMLASTRGWTLPTLMRKSGFDAPTLRRALARLEIRGFVRKMQSKWASVPRRESCGVESIVSIEAKMSDCQQVINQAVLNRTFSNESYVLISTRHPSKNTLSAAKDFGLGVYVPSCRGKYVRLQKPTVKRGVAYSYARWYFNEWIGRRIARERGAER